MDRYAEYEKAVLKNKKDNEKYLDEFEKWLNIKGLTDKTIRNHVNNVDFYINEFLNYYDANSMEKGCFMIYEYLNDFFIRKCMWSTAYTLKTTAASIKKFYQCMGELGYVKKEDYLHLSSIIKENIDDWILNVEEYNSFDDDDFDIW